MLTRLVILAIILLVIWVGFSFRTEKNLSASIILPSTTWLTTKLIPESPFPLQAKAGIVIDKESGQILYQRNPNMQLPIASLTKLMTALVADYNEDLFYKMLVWSDNEATEKLVVDVEKLNQKAKDLGLKKTHFVDATGLEPGNVSTATDLVLLFKEVLKNKNLVKILSTKKYKNLENTNELLDLPGVIAGKTGFTDEAGQCLILVTNKYITVVLGAEDRFVESEKLINLFNQ